MDIALLGVLWLITSVPLVTIGAAGYAMNAVMAEYVDDQKPPILKRYFQLFRSGFRAATKIWMVHLLVFAVLGVDLFYYWLGDSQMDTLGFVLLATALTLAALECNMVFICLTQRSGAGSWEVVRFAFDISMTCFWQCLTVALFSIALPAAAAVLAPESIILTPGIGCYLNWRTLPEVFRKYRFKKAARDHRKSSK